MKVSPSPVEDRQSHVRLVATALVAALSLVLGPLAFAPAQAAEPGSISGTVVDSSDTDTPVPTASIEVRSADDDDASPITAVAADDGSFTVPDVPAGRYVVEFRDVFGGHLSEFYDDARDMADAEVVVVEAGVDTPLPPVALDQGASLSGSVMGSRIPEFGESDRVPVDGAIVRALPVVDGTVDSQGVVTVTTDAEGDYSITDLPSGSYKIEVSADTYFDAYNGSQPTAELAAEIEVGVGEDVTVGTILLEQTAGIIGTTENAAGASLKGIAVDAYPVANGVPASQSAVSTVSAENGSYALHPLRAGEYRLRFRDPSGVYRERFDTTMTIEGGENQASADVTVLAPVAAPVVPPAPYAPPAVSKKTASIKVSAKGAKKKATLTITVKASGVTPTGKVTIKLGGKTLKTVTLKRGKAKVTLKKQKKGKRTYKVVYSGDSKVRGKTVTSKKVKIR